MEGPNRYIPTAGIIQVLNEGLMVSQFGCAKPLKGAPIPANGRLTLSVEGSIEHVHAKLNGSLADGLPASIEYSSANGRRGLLVELTPERDTLTISRVAGERVISKILYHILAVHEPPIVMDLSSHFGWRTYQEGAGPLRVTLRTNHSDFDTEIDTTGELKIKHALPASVAPLNGRSPKKDVKRYIVFGLLSMMSVGAGLLLWTTRKQDKNPTEKKLK